MSSLVLAIEPDHRQASILKRIVHEKVHAELVLVDSRDAAIAAINAQIPDVILVTALLSPRDEEELVAHLRGLDGAEHLQTHTIPQLAASRIDREQKSGGGGLFGKLRRKKEAEPIAGCDPDLFADEIRNFLERAAQMKAEAVSALKQRVVHLEDAAERANPAASLRSRTSVGNSFVSEPAAAPGGGESSAWDSPFEWRRSEPPAELAIRNETEDAAAPAPEPLITNVPLAVLAAEEETRASEEERQRLEAERLRLETEAAAERERAEQMRAEADQQRLEAERLRAEAEAAAERAKAEERRRLEAEQAREKERQRVEAEARAAAERAREEERKRAEAAAQAAAEKARQEERKRAEEERKRAEAAAQAAAEKARQEERKRAEAAAKAAAEKAREEERKRAEEERKRAEAAAKAAAEKAREEERKRAEEERKRVEEERRRLEAERQRLEAEARAAREREAERLRLEAEAAAARARDEERRRVEAERLRVEAEAAAERERAERLRIEEEHRRAEAERRRLEEEAAAERERAAAAQRRRDKRRHATHGDQPAAAGPLVVPDQFAEFREEYDHVGPGVFRLMPLAAWARTEVRRAAEEPQAAGDDLRDLMEHLALPPHVAGVSYAQGCRIRRVRVPADRAARKGHGKQTVILSRRALDEARAAADSQSSDPS